MRVWRAGVVVMAVLGMAQQAPVIRVPVRLVTVPTLVFSSDGRLVSGLQKSDFRVFDNGHPQRLTVDLESSPVSIATAVQANLAVRDYVPFIAKTGNVIDALLAGENGESALVTYGDDVRVVKSFDSSELSAAFKKVSPSGRSSRMLDGASRAIDMLKGRPASHARILLLVGQPMDSGSETALASVREQAEQENLTVFALALPEMGKAFVSDTFSLEGLPRDRGGLRAGTDLKNLFTVLDRRRRDSRARTHSPCSRPRPAGRRSIFESRRSWKGRWRRSGLR